MKLREREQRARQRLCLALDVPTVQAAVELARELAELVGLFKVGKQLHTAAGTQGVNILGELAAAGAGVFLDLKLHDTPSTVCEASRACAVPGVSIFNVHVAGGEEMCKKAVEGAREGAQAEGLPGPKTVGVTVLTSLNDRDLATQGLGIAYDDLVARRTELAREWGLDGIVCPANKAGELERRFGSDFLYVTPGLKWAGKQGAGQKQLYTPDLAVRDCTSSILVIGSAITKADDRRVTAYDIVKAMAREL